MEENFLTSKFCRVLGPEYAGVKLPRVPQSSYLRKLVNALRRRLHPQTIVESLMGLETIPEVITGMSRYAQGNHVIPFRPDWMNQWYGFYRNPKSFKEALLKELGGAWAALGNVGVETEEKCRVFFEKIRSRNPQLQQRYFRTIHSRLPLIDKQIQNEYDEEIEELLSLVIYGTPEVSSDESASAGPALLFFVYVEIPLLLEGEESSQSLFLKSLRGDVQSIEKLLRKDPMLRFDSDIENVVNRLCRENRDEPFRKYLTGRGGIPASDRRLFASYRIKCLFSALMIERSRKFKAMLEQLGGLAESLRCKLRIPKPQNRCSRAFDWSRYRSMRVSDVFQMLTAWSKDRGLTPDPDLLGDSEAFRRNVSRIQRLVRVRNWDISLVR